MPHFANRNHASPPGEWQVLHPEIGMEHPFSGSFRRCCEFETSFRKKNPFMCKKHNWTTEKGEIEKYVEQSNVARCIAHGWTSFLVMDDAPYPTAYIPIFQKKTEAGAAAFAVEGKTKHATKAAAGIGLVYDWLGEGLEPVNQEEAEKRALVCSVCPKNQPGDFFQRVEAVIARNVRTLIEVAKDLKLRTSLDEKLESCMACDCWLKLKVWPPLKHIIENTSPEVMADLDPGCWIKK